MVKRIETILLIEDEKDYKLAMSNKLGFEGYMVLEAKNGQEGLTIALDKKPDLIILDLMMPIMDGIKCLRGIRNHDDWGKNVPVFIITAVSADKEDVRQELSILNPTFYFEKGNITLRELVDLINSKVLENLGK